MKLLASTAISFHLLGADLNPPLALGLLHFGNDNGQNAVLHAGFDVVMVHRVGKGEASSKFTNTAFGNPVRVLRVVLGNLLGSSGRHFSAGRGSLWFVVDFGGRRWGAFLPGALGPALHSDCLFVGELNDDIFLVDAGEFALEKVVIFRFLHVELWCKGPRCGVGELLEFRERVVEEVKEWAHLVTVGAEG